MIEKPKFWRWARLTVDSNNHEEILQSKRVNIIPEIEISSDDADGSHIPSSSMLAILESLFAAVVEGSSHLKSIEIISSQDLRTLDHELLSQALIRLEECTFCETTCSPLSTDQLVSLFKAIDQTSDLKLRVLNLPNEDYSQVPPEVLAAAVVKLEETDILSVPLPPEHVRSLFTKIVESPVVNIKNLDPSLTDYSNNIPPELFADALVRIVTVERIKGNDSVVRKEQVESLLRKIATTDHLRVRNLSLCWVNLSHIKPVVVSEAAVRLETLAVISPGLTGEFFQRVGDCLDPRLRELSVKHEDLSSVEPSVLVGAISRLERLTLFCCNLSASQLTAVFSQFSVSEHHRLKFIRLAHNDLSSVPPELLVTALMSGLEDVDLYKTNLTPVQLTEIYTMVADRKPQRLGRITLSRNDHSSIPPDLIQRAGLNPSIVIV